MTRVLRLLLAVAGVCCAQQTYEIRGTVTEPGLGGVGGVEVRVLKGTAQVAIDPVTRAITALEPIVRTFTNARGEFAVPVTAAGEYRVSVGRDGFVVIGDSAPFVRLDQGRPKGEAMFEVARLVQITGRVIDDATGKPIEGLQLVVQNPRGEVVQWITADFPAVIVEEARRTGRRPGLTDDRGVFQLTMRPGSYVVGIMTTPPKVGVDYPPEVIDSEYERVFWPGGLPLVDVQPMQMGSGAVMNLGDMRLKKVQQYRVHILLPQGQCPEGESVRLAIAQKRVPQIRSVGVHKCGSDVVVPGLEPGAYGVYAVSDWQGERDNVEDAVWGRADFSVTKENAEVTVDLHHGVVLEGQLKAAEGFTGLPERFAIVAQPLDAIFDAKIDREEFIEWGEKGRFRMAVGPGRQTLVPMLTGAAGTGLVYVGRIILNGAPLQDMTLDLKSGEKPRLELEMDDKFGTIEGNVEGPIRFVQTRRTDGPGAMTVPVVNGIFRTLAPPGEYRLTDDSVPLELANSTGEKVTVKAGEIVKVKLRR